MKHENTNFYFEINHRFSIELIYQLKKKTAYENVNETFEI